ncbi:MAG: hypothetical protein JSV24_08115, partial [Bacteroidales bacterium]
SWYPDKHGNFSELYTTFNHIIDLLKKNRIEQAAQYDLLNTILKGLKVGILSVNDSNRIELINEAACRILNMTAISSYRQLAIEADSFTRELDDMKDGEQRLVKFNVKGERKNLSVRKEAFKYLGRDIRIISFSDIRSEIEHHELEAWKKLSRIVTHEIMNSITPISSLTETSLMLLKEKNGRQKSPSGLKHQNISSLIIALNTISGRIETLENFVTEYRKLAKLPVPQFDRIKIRDIFSRIEHLMKEELNQRSIRMIIEYPDLKRRLYCDVRLIEQVLLNLVRNAIEALEGRPDPIIRIGIDKPGATRIHITDNGKGIPEKVLEDIFIPFFSTKETGSGIGLSISKQIMQLHKGNLEVRSIQNSGSTFSLYFPEQEVLSREE